MAAVLAGNVHINPTRFGDADFTFQIPSYELPAESDLGRFVPEAKGVTLSGTISAQGKGSISSAGIHGDVDLAMKGGELRMTDKKITVAGIDANLRFPELPRIRSGPAQPIRFSRAAMGGIVMDGGMFDVQVESENTLFIEKGRLNWCGGKVDAQALRITAGKQDYQVSLYCQRLGLSRILDQRADDLLRKRRKRHTYEHHGGERSDMDRHVERQTLIRGSHQHRKQDEMAGGRDGKKLGDALHDRENGKLEQGHRTSRQRRITAADVNRQTFRI